MSSYKMPKHAEATQFVEHLRAVETDLRRLSEVFPF
jgi:hypothetical protein